MAIEIERKFLVISDLWRQNIRREIPMRQGYFETAPGATVRVRLQGERAVFTIKGPTRGIARAEFEYEIPPADARAMLALFCEGRQVEKTRYLVEFAEKIWEVDVFSGAHQGLIVAEIEMSRPDEEVALPVWVGEEVSADPRFRNAYLARHPGRPDIEA